MMATTNGERMPVTDKHDIARMPRGGPDASWLDRLLQTNRPEYLDRADVDTDVKRKIVRALNRMGELFGEHERNAHLVLRELEDVGDPRILELGAGHGRLSRILLDEHPTARVTVTDLSPASVATIAASDLASHRRAKIKVMDATSIDAADRAYDLAVFALSFHHLPPEQASRAIAEGTRVADRFMIIDMPRLRSPLHLVRLATMLPFVVLHPFAHDGFITSLRTYSRSAFQALAAHADPSIELRFVDSLLGPEVVVASRQSAALER